MKYLNFLCILLVILISLSGCFSKNKDLQNNNSNVGMNSELKVVIATAKSTIMQSNNIPENCILISSISEDGEKTWRVYYKIKLSIKGVWNPTDGDYCVDIEQNISTNKYGAVFEKNDKGKLSIFINIPFSYLYTGFILQKENKLPLETMIVNTEKEWQEFKNKYFLELTDMDYRFNTSIPVDFSRESIVYDSKPSAKEDIYSMAYQIDRVELVDNKIGVDMKYIKNEPMITVANYEFAVHKYITLLKVKKSNLVR